MKKMIKMPSASSAVLSPQCLGQTPEQISNNNYTYRGSSLRGTPKSEDSKRMFSQAIFLHSREQPAPATDTFFTSRGCTLTTASTVYCIWEGGVAQCGVSTRL